MKLEEELIITRRWLTDSRHMSQASGTQYYMKINMYLLLIIIQSIRNISTNCIIHQFLYSYSYHFIFHAIESCVKKEYRFKTQVQPECMAYNENRTNSYQYSRQVHFTMTIARLNISSGLSYASVIVNIG